MVALSLRKFVDTRNEDRSFEVSFNGWKTYRDILSSYCHDAAPEIMTAWEKLCSYDCIMGGVDLDMGYL